MKPSQVKKYREDQDAALNKEIQTLRKRESDLEAEIEDLRKRISAGTCVEDSRTHERNDTEERLSALDRLIAEVKADPSVEVSQHPTIARFQAEDWRRKYQMLAAKVKRL